MNIISKQPRVYIAAPFFNPEQLDIVENIKDILDNRQLPFFSPRDECLFKPGETTPAEVLSVNITALLNTDLTVCVTDGRDPGTMFEAGWCFAQNIPIIYVWLGGLPGQKFNLVLAASGAVVRSYEQLNKALKDIIATGDFKLKSWDAEEISYE